MTKVKIMIAGVVMNLVTAFFLLTILALVGMPKLIENQYIVDRDVRVTHNEVLVGYVEPDSPAAKAGLQQRDQLLSIGTPDHITTISTADDLPAVTKGYAGQTVTLTVDRQGRELALQPKLRDRKEVAASQKTAEPKGYLGISPTEYTLRRSTWSAPIVAGGLIGQFTGATFKALGSLVAGLAHGHGSEAASQVAGPVGIFVLIKDGSLLGYQFILMIIAIISLTLALMNVLPIPALDGGRLFVTLVYRSLRRPLTKKAEDRIHGTGFALLMVLFVVITVVDIKRFF
jgi:regulator of sigma E protease